jgi:hypothetical protein
MTGLENIELFASIFSGAIGSVNLAILVNILYRLKLVETDTRAIDAKLDGTHEKVIRLETAAER